MSKQYLLGVDVGTSVVKAVLFDLEGTPQHIASESVAILTPQPGWSEQDMTLVWKTSASVIRDVVSQIDPAAIAAVGVTAQGDGAWMLDNQHKPVMPAPLWNDGRAADVVSAWEDNGVLQGAYENNGTVLWPGSLGAVLAWLKQNDPAKYAEIDTVFCCKDWIKYQLTGVQCTDETDGSIPFMRLSERAFSDHQLELLGVVDIKDKLAPVVASHEIIGEITPQASKATGLTAGTPVVSGMLDVVACALGGGVIHAGQSFCILGTTAIMGIVLDEPRFEPVDVGASVCYSVPGQWLRVLGTMSGTPNLEWYLDTVCNMMADVDDSTSVYDVLEERVAQVPVGADGVMFHPFLQGERVPFLNSNARGSFFGLSSGTEAAHLARAVYEGVAYSIMHCYDAIGAKVDEVVLTGGGANSAVWCQILADQLDARVVVPAGEQFGALGAAIAAGIGVGIYNDYESAAAQCVKPDRVYTPNPEHVKQYGAWFKLYTHLIETMESYWSERQSLLDHFNEAD